MYYALTLSLAFKQKTIPDKAAAAVKYLIDNAFIVNPRQDDEERGFIELARCYHDESPHRDCKRLKRWDVPYPP
ncbi:hypothetical protein ES703_105445 [subsurface metagenome]